MAATLDQVLASLQSVYQPQLDSVSQQQAALPAQYDAQAQGLQAQQQNAFGSILDSARSRGTGVAFGGIPLQEQAQYTAGTYLPALANLQTAQTQQQQSLADQINSINEDKFNTGNNLYQFGVNQDYQQQQLAEQAREADQTAALQKQANSDTFGPTVTGDQSTPGTQGAANPLTVKNLTGGKSQQDAYNQVQSLLSTKNAKTITDTIKAIQASANYGNTYDQAKLKTINSMPEFQQYVSNINNATF